MLVPGAASNPWEMLSSLQPLQPANPSAAAAGIGVGQFVTDGAAPPAATSGVQSATLAPGATSQPLFSPDVLGFLIWNQSQPGGGAPSTANVNNPPATDSGSSTATTAAASGTDQSGLASWPAFPSWFPPLSTDGAGNIDAFGPNNSGGSSGTAATPTPTSQSNTKADPILAAGQPDAAPESSGVHGHHHHHHGGFGPQSQSGASDPFANLFGTSTQDGSSTTATNADGSTTTTITYADGSEVMLTTPAQASNGNAVPTTAAAQPPLNSNNFLETLIQLQARLLAPTAAA
jgi:hypothetical protein